MNDSANLDIRLPMGALFAVIGLLLVLYGVVAQSATTSLSANIDLWWGLIMFIFGALMLALARASRLRHTHSGGAGQ